MQSKSGVFTGTSYEAKGKQNPLNILYMYTLVFLYLLLGHTSASRRDLRWSSSELNCNEKLWQQSQTTVVPKSLGHPVLRLDSPGDMARLPMHQHCRLHSATVSPISALWVLREIQQKFCCIDEPKLAKIMASFCKISYRTLHLDSCWTAVGSVRPDNALALD